MGEPLKIDVDQAEQNWLDQHREDRRRERPTNDSEPKEKAGTEAPAEEADDDQE